MLAGRIISCRTRRITQSVLHNVTQSFAVLTQSFTMLFSVNMEFKLYHSKFVNRCSILISALHLVPSVILCETIFARRVRRISQKRDSSCENLLNPRHLRSTILHSIPHRPPSAYHLPPFINRRVALRGYYCVIC